MMAPSPIQSIPRSTSIINIRAINATADLLCSAEGFVKPIVKGYEDRNLPTMCFLLENKKLGKTVLFDCGSRKDFWNFAPIVKKMLRVIIPGLRVDKNVDEVLQEVGVDMGKIGVYASMMCHRSHTTHHSSRLLLPFAISMLVFHVLLSGTSK